MSCVISRRLSGEADNDPNRRRICEFRPCQPVLAFIVIDDRLRRRQYRRYISDLLDIWADPRTTRAQREIIEDKISDFQRHLRRNDIR